MLIGNHVICLRNYLGKRGYSCVSNAGIKYAVKRGPTAEFRYSRSYVPVRYSQKAVNNQKSSHKFTGLHSRLGNYLFGRFFIFVKGYEKILESKFPRAFKVYQIFAVGLKQFYRDIKLYGTLTIRLNQGKTFNHFSRYEIEKYYTMPKEIKRVAPVLLISAIPFANYIIFPLAYMFPKKLLSSHFWNIQQKVDFAVQDHKHKLLNYRPVFRHMQAKVNTIKDSELREKCANILFKLGSGTHPSVTDILTIRVLFSSEPFSISHLSFSHIVSMINWEEEQSGLSRMHGLSVFGLRKRRLRQHASIIQKMDLAILREKIQSMNLEELRGSCFLRGVNPIGMSKDAMLVWLNDWIEVTSQIDERSLSLLLHCPIMLSYNYPTNWSLIH